jgi:hypothetical protein
LTAYQKDLSRSFPDFVDIVEHETALRGNAQYEADKRAVPQIGSIASISFEWAPTKGKNFKVTYNVFPNNDELHVIYGDTKGPCPNP